MYRPLKFWRINQPFGQNKVCINNKDSTDLIMCDGKKPPKGYRSVYGKAGHKGIDLYGRIGTPVFAAQRGVVEFIDTNDYSGLDVRIKSEEGGFVFTHIYEHLTSFNVEIGEAVETGQVIGNVGTTGYSTGPHLHFECRDINGKSFNPIPRMEPYFAGEIFMINHKLGAIAQSLALLTSRLSTYLTEKSKKL